MDTENASGMCYVLFLVNVAVMFSALYQRDFSPFYSLWYTICSIKVDKNMIEIVCLPVNTSVYMYFCSTRGSITLGIFSVTVT